MTLGVDGEEKKMYDQQPLPFTEKDPLAPKLEVEEEETSTSSSFVFMQPTELPKKTPVTKTNAPVHFELFNEKEETPKEVQPKNGNIYEKSSAYHEIKLAENKEIKHLKNKIPEQHSKGFLSKP